MPRLGTTDAKGGEGGDTANRRDGRIRIEAHADRQNQRFGRRGDMDAGEVLVDELHAAAGAERVPEPEHPRRDRIEKARRLSLDCFDAVDRGAMEGSPSRRDYFDPA